MLARLNPCLQAIFLAPTSMPTMPAWLLAACLILSLTISVQGHGAMMKPASRNFLAFNAKREYDAHSLNAGGEY
jgi:hypothetical protein